MRYNVAVFDMDGTILDTLEDLKNSVNFALRGCGFPERTLDEIRTFVGNGIRLLVERAVPEGTSTEKTDECFAAFKAHYAAHSLDVTKPYEGIAELIKELRARGVKTAVVSNKIDSAVQELCRTFFDGLFDSSVGEREGVARKPAPDSVFTALKEMNVTAENAVYIGDSEVDVATARNSGLPCIAVLWGFRSKELLEKLTPEYIVEKPEQILGIIEGE